MTQEKIVLLGQSAAELIELFRSESAPGSQIREYFRNLFGFPAETYRDMSARTLQETDLMSRHTPFSLMTTDALSAFVEFLLKT